MASLPGGIDRITVSESVAIRARLLKQEQDEGRRLYIHRLDDQMRGPRDPDGSQQFNVNELVPGVFHWVDLLI